MGKPNSERRKVTSRKCLRGNILKLRGLRKATNEAGGIIPLNSNVIPETSFPPNLLNKWKTIGRPSSTIHEKVNEVMVSTEVIPETEEQSSQRRESTAAVIYETVTPDETKNIAAGVDETKLITLSSSTGLSKKENVTFEDLLLSTAKAKPRKRNKRESISSSSSEEEESITPILMDSDNTDEFLDTLLEAEVEKEEDANDNYNNKENLNSTGNETENIELYNCINRVIENVFDGGETILVSVSPKSNFVFPNTISNPRLIFSEKNLYINERSIGFQMGILLYLDDTKNSDRINLTWKSKLVKRNMDENVKWVIVTQSSDVASYFIRFWQKELLHAVVLQYNLNSAKGFFRLFTADPQSIPNKCGYAVNLVNNQTCNSNIVVDYPKPLRKYVNCTFKVYTFADSIDEIKHNHTFNIIHNFLLKQITTHLHSKKLRNSKHHTDFIVIPSFLRYVKHGARCSTTFYSTKAMWTVPKPKRIPMIRVIGVIFDKAVWATIIISFIVTAIFWWLIVKYANKSVEDKCSFSVILLNTWELTLFGCVNNVPVLWATRFLVITYIACFIHIQAVLNSKIIEVLTVPQYEHGIQNLEELLESDLPIIAHPNVKKLVFDNNSIEMDVRYKKIQRLLTDFESVKDIQKILIDCIAKYKCAAFFSGEEQYLTDDVLKISNLINDNSLTGNFDAVLVYPLGSYISITFDKMLGAFFEGGIINDFTQKLEMGKFKFVSTETKTPLAIYNVYVLFIFLGIGYIVSVICFICEIVTKHYKRRKH
ncbi:hypothetical protein FQR65_LT13654 [Abscondita terminalis]|nr:hypothetical protein FQR65_LT13654 [Abscondita terminalis]